MFEFFMRWAELAYYLSGIGVAAAILYGVQQVSLLKKDIRLRNERAAKEKAIEYASRYLTVYVALDGSFLDEYSKIGLRPYNGPVGDFTIASLPYGGKEAARRFHLSSWLPAMNELEALAAAFTTGVADDLVGFMIIGRAFCEAVQDRYDLIAFSRQHEEGVPFAYWNNIVQLYRMWFPRLSESDLLRMKEKLESRLAEAAAAAGSPRKPIGVD